MQALQRTLEFEEELAEKFSGGTTTARNKELESDDENEGTEHNKIVSDIRKKYEKKLGVPNDEAEQVFAAYLLSLSTFFFLCWYFLSNSSAIIYWQDKEKQKDLSVPGAGVSSLSTMGQCMFITYLNYELCVIYSYIIFCSVLWQFNFHGIISSCFEPYMAVYIELEEKSLVEQLDKLIQVR